MSLVHLCYFHHLVSMINEKQGLLSLREHLDSLPFIFFWVLVAHLFRCIVFFVLFAFALCPVAIVTCGSGLSILDCPVVFSNVYSFALCSVAIVTCGSGLSILDCPVVFSNVYFVSINISHFNSNKIFQLVLIRYPV